MPVIATGTTYVEEQLAKMARAIAKLTKMVEEKDMQITSLINKVEAQVQNTSESSHRLNHLSNVASPLDDAPHTYRTMQGERETTEFASMASLSVQQLQDMITNTIRAQYGGPSQSTLMYSKPYTKRIDNLRMPMGYQPSKFQSFEGKGNPKQHVAHFVETCNNAGTDGDLLVKQFVRSLRGNAFDWYINLAPECIDSWDQMEREFLNRFYSTRRTVSMMELTNTKQWKDEPVVDYINRWCSLSLDCKDRLSEVSAVEMCIQGMHWGLLYILQGIRSRTFEELATRAHDMELSIANHDAKNDLIIDQQRERHNGKASDKISIKSIQESMMVNVTLARNKKKEVKEVRPTQENERCRFTFKELKEKRYPFPDSDVPSMLEDLLQKKVIELPECKRPEEMGRLNDPNYCHYHRIISHPVEKCFILKDLIMKLVKQRRIHLDLDEVVESNHTTVTFGSLDPVLLHVPLKKLGACADTIQCESPKPKQTQVSCQDTIRHFYFDNESMSYNEEGWTLVT